MRKTDRSVHLAAFTLVELLVVIGIIAVLISILLPSLSGAMRSADNLRCLSNLRQIGTAMHMYADAHKGVLPSTWSYPHVLTHKGTTYNPIELYWGQLLQIKGLLPGQDNPSKSVLVCPVHAEPFAPFTSTPALADSFKLSYGLNNFLSIHDGASFSPGGALPDGKDDFDGHAAPKALALKGSAEKILVGEVFYGYLLDSDSPNEFSPLPSWHQLDWKRHSRSSSDRGRGNVLWLDGHATTLREGIDAVGITNDLNSVATWKVGAEVAAKGKLQWQP